jgi:DnaK suppressor protein
MDTRDVAEELRVRRDQLTAELGIVTTVERDPDASVSFGKRVGDGTTAAVERLNLVGTARELEAMLGDVERALRKLEEGTYGICDRCAKLISEARLEARPWSVLCIDCAALRR